MKVLITGFEPFGKDTINSSYECIKDLPKSIDDHEIIIAEIPVSMAKSIDMVVALIDKISPDIIISLGQAGGRKHITPERVAINVLDYRIEDNDGNQPINIPIIENGDVGYFSTLPCYSIVENLSKVGIDACISNTAGTYVCNTLMYGVLYYIRTNNLDIKAGFIHIPYCDLQVKDKEVFSISLDTLSEAVLNIVNSCINCNDDDVKQSYSSTH